MNELIDTKKLCEWLNISENTAYNWRKKENLPFIKITKKTIMYDKNEVNRWLEERNKRD